MGEVYRATDTKLKRQVAIKVLPASVAGDAERLARFQREAEVLASLNHPNIAAIYGLEESDGVKALVMELVEGTNARGPHRAGCDPARRGVADRQANRRSTRSGARAGHHSSRSETREHQSPSRRDGEGAGLRPGEGDGAGIRDRRHGIRGSQLADDHVAGDDDARGDSRHGGLHVAGAGEGTHGGHARGHLGLRRRPVRDARRTRDRSRATRSQTPSPASSRVSPHGRGCRVTHLGPSNASCADVSRRIGISGYNTWAMRGSRSTTRNARRPLTTPPAPSGAHDESGWSGHRRSLSPP